MNKDFVIKNVVLSEEIIWQVQFYATATKVKSKDLLVFEFENIDSVVFFFFKKKGWSLGFGFVTLLLW